MQLMQAASSAPPFWQTKEQTEHVGPVKPVPSQRQVQSRSVTAATAQADEGQAVGVAGFTTARPERDSIVASSVPRLILKTPHPHPTAHKSDINTFQCLPSTPDSIFSLLLFESPASLRGSPFKKVALTFEAVHQQD